MCISDLEVFWVVDLHKSCADRHSHQRTCVPRDQRAQRAVKLFHLGPVLGGRDGGEERCFLYSHYVLTSTGDPHGSVCLCVHSSPRKGKSHIRLVPLGSSSRLLPRTGCPRKWVLFFPSTQCGEACLSPQWPRTHCRFPGVSLWPVWLWHWTSFYQLALTSNEEDISAAICYSLVLFLNLFTAQTEKKVRDPSRQLRAKKISYYFLEVYYWRRKNYQRLQGTTQAGFPRVGSSASRSLGMWEWGDYLKCRFQSQPRIRNWNNWGRERGEGKKWGPGVCIL